MYLSSKKLAEIYKNKVLVEMDVASVVGVSSTENKLENSDDYATGSTQIPYLIGRIQTRKGSVRKKRKNNKKGKKLARNVRSNKLL